MKHPNRLIFPNSLILILYFNFGFTSCYPEDFDRDLMPSRALVHLYRGNDKIKYIKTKKNLSVGVTDKILMKIRDNRTLPYYINKYNLELIKSYRGSLFLMKVDTDSKVFDIVNSLKSEEGVIYVHPDFIKKRVLR